MNSGATLKTKHLSKTGSCERAGIRKFKFQLKFVSMSLHQNISFHQNVSFGAKKKAADRCHGNSATQLSLLQCVTPITERSGFYTVKSHHTQKKKNLPA